MLSRSRNQQLILFVVRLLRWIDRTTNPSQRLISSLSTELLSPFNNMRGCKVLDIGCGVKPYESTLRRSLHPCSYVGVDPYPADDSIIGCDSSELPFSGSEFDFVCSFDVIQHVESPSALLSEASRVLSSNGLFLISFPFLYPECDAIDFRRWSIDGMKILLEQHNFAVIDYRFRGGPIHALLMILIWSIEHFIPPQRSSFRAPRTLGSGLRAILLLLVLMPFRLLTIVSLPIDNLLRHLPMYMGSVMLCKKIV